MTTTTPAPAPAPEVVTNFQLVGQPRFPFTRAEELQALVTMREGGRSIAALMAVDPDPEDPTHFKVGRVVRRFSTPRKTVFQGDDGIIRVPRWVQPGRGPATPQHPETGAAVSRNSLFRVYPTSSPEAHYSDELSEWCASAAQRHNAVNTAYTLGRRMVDLLEDQGVPSGSPAAPPAYLRRPRGLVTDDQIAEQAYNLFEASVTTGAPLPIECVYKDAFVENVDSDPDAGYGYILLRDGNGKEVEKTFPISSRPLVTEGQQVFAGDRLYEAFPVVSPEEVSESWAAVQNTPIQFPGGTQLIDQWLVDELKSFMRPSIGRMEGTPVACVPEGTQVESQFVFVPSGTYTFQVNTLEAEVGRFSLDLRKVFEAFKGLPSAGRGQARRNRQDAGTAEVQQAELVPAGA